MYGITTLFTNPLLFVVSFLALILSIGIHEFSHVLSAYLQGDMTGKAMGRLTLNPIRHLDLFGTIMMVFAGIGWGKPAPYNPYNLRFHRWGSALVAIAGPISNILIMLIAGYALMFFGQGLPATNLLRIFLDLMVLLNGALAVFNLLPIAPLDGSHILEGILGATHPLVVALQRYGMYILIFMLIFGQSLLSGYILGGTNILLNLLGLHSLS